MGDHLLILIRLPTCNTKPVCNYRRDWRNYSIDLLCSELAKINWTFENVGVKNFWNYSENGVITETEKTVLDVEFTIILD